MAQRQFPRTVPIGVVNPVTGEITPLTLSASGALQVDLIELEDVQINLPEGTSLDVDVKNTDPIPVDLPAEKVVDVEVQNTDPIPVDLPAEKVVDVEVKNTDPIGVEFGEAQEIKNADGAPVETVMQYPWGTGHADLKPRSGTATITVATDASNSDVQNGYGMDLLRFKMPANPVGTAFSIQFCTASDGTPADMQDETGSAFSIDVTANNKGKWVNMHLFAPFARGMFYFRFVSNDTETANQEIEYVLG